MDGIPISELGLLAKVTNLGLYLFYTLILLGSVLWVVNLWDRRRPEINFWAELKNGNKAVAIFLSVLFFSVFLFAAFAGAAEARTTRYDRHFEKAWHLYMGPVGDWQWLKAQGMQESALRPDVCSPAGACGLMQFMPSTARDRGLDRFDPVASIYAGANYDAWLWRNWSAPRPARDRLYLTLGSYNWGLGNLLRIQGRLAGEGQPSALWAHLEPHLPTETSEYPVRIARWCQRFTGGRPCSIGL